MSAICGYIGLDVVMLIWFVEPSSANIMPNVDDNIGTHRLRYRYKKTLLQLLVTRFQGGRWDSNGEAIEPIPNKKAQTEGRAINHNNIGSTPTKENQFTHIISVEQMTLLSSALH